jgi:hypothetical protein
VSKTEKARRSARDRRPNEVPHHPKLLTLAWIVAAAAFAIMGLWFWAMLTGQGLIVTAERNTAAANAELAAAEDARAVEEEVEDSAPAPVVITPDNIEIEPPSEADPELNSFGAVPAVPEETDTVTEQWDLSAWSVLSRDGNLVVSGNLTNQSGQAQSGEVRVYVYSGGESLATTTLNVVDFPDEASERVELESQTVWEPGSKVLLLQYVPDSTP